MERGGHQRHLDHEQIEYKAHRLRDGLAVVEAFCLDLLGEVRGVETSKRRLCSRLIKRYYSGVGRFHLVVLGPKASKVYGWMDVQIFTCPHLLKDLRLTVNWD